MKSFFSVPNQEVVYEHGDNFYRRVQPMVCPVCSDIYYGYKSDDSVMSEPIIQRQDMIPSYNGWLKFRMTCGDPACYLTEERRWLRQSPAYQQAIENSNNRFTELNESRRESLREVKPRNAKPIKLLSLEDTDE